MSIPKTGKSKNGQSMHYSVGALIEKDNKFLLIDRVAPPLGFAGIAGHINEGETPEEALFRKVSEESGLKVKSYSLLFEEEVEWNWCRIGIQSHYWYVYKCEVEGEARNNAEASKSIGWYTLDEIGKFKMEPVWKYWFEKIGFSTEK